MNTSETTKPPQVGGSALNDGLYIMEYSGSVVEMGDLEEFERGLLVEIRPQVFIKLTGFARHDIMAMSNILYKKVKITIEVVYD